MTVVTVNTAHSTWQFYEFSTRILFKYLWSKPEIEFPGVNCFITILYFFVDQERISDFQPEKIEFLLFMSFNKTLILDR